MDLRIRVGASADASLGTVFRPLFAASQAAQKKVEADFAKTAQAASRAAAEGAKAQQAQIDRTVAAHRSAAKIQADLIRSVQQQRNREHAQFLQELREQEREQKKAAKAIAEEQKKASRAKREADREAGQIGSAAMRTFGGIMRAGAGVGGSIARGAGVDVSIEGLTRKGVGLEDLAVGIVNQGNRGTGTAAGRDAMVGNLQSQAREIGGKYAFDPSKVLSGLGQYQALTGDLDTGLAGLERQSRLAKAFKVDLDAMIASAGQVGAAIGEIGEGKEFATAEQKAVAIDDVLRTLTAQGQEGAIEIANMATQMAKLKAAGGRFEGSTAESIKRMGALAQLSLQLGGAASPTQAATSVMGFANTLSTPARRAHFKGFGVDIMSKTEQGAFANPFEIIKRSLSATGGDVEKMKKMWANVVGERAVTALSTTYRKAGGGTKGLAAVDEQFARFGGTVSDAQISENVARELKTTASQAQLFNNEMESVAASAAGEVLPALRELAPAAKSAASVLAEMVTFGAQHPGTAITAAIVASIAKESIGKVVGDRLATMIGSISGGTGLAIGSAVIAIAAAQMMVEAWNKDKDAARQEKIDTTATTEDLLLKAEGQFTKSGKVEPALMEELMRRRADIAGEEKRAQLYEPPEQGIGARFKRGFVRLGAFLTGNNEELAQYEGAGQAAAERQGQLASQGKGIDALISQLRGTLQVHVVNAADMKPGPNGPGPVGPGVDAGARSESNK